MLVSWRVTQDYPRFLEWTKAICSIVVLLSDLQGLCVDDLLLDLQFRIEVPWLTMLKIHWGLRFSRVEGNAPSK